MKGGSRICPVGNKLCAVGKELWSENCVFALGSQSGQVAVELFNDLNINPFFSNSHMIIDSLPSVRGLRKIRYGYNRLVRQFIAGFFGSAGPGK